MLRYSAGMICMLLLTATAHAQDASAPPAAALPSMPAMPVAPNVASPQPPSQISAPALELPEVNVPSVPAVEPMPQAVPPAEPVASMPAAEAPAKAAPVEIDPVSYAPVDPEATYSYGTSDISLLFTPAQTKRMKSMLSMYESARRNNSNVAIEVVEEIASQFAPTPPPTEEPAMYPVFTLKSIAYRNPTDWTVWIGDLRITPSKNKQEVRVVAVSRDRAQFVWKPAYAQAMQTRNNLKRYAPIDKVKHKMTRPNSAMFDAATGQASFSLLPNQTFAPGYMATFEGKVIPPKLEPIKDGDGADGADAADGTKPEEIIAPANTSAENQDNLDALLKSQQKGGVNSIFQRTLRNNNPPAPAPAN